MHILLNVTNITMIGYSWRHIDAVHFEFAQIMAYDEPAIAAFLGRHLINVQVAILGCDQESIGGNEITSVIS